MSLFQEPSTSFSHITVMVAISIPTADKKFPFLAVSALPRSLIPLIKKMQAIIYETIIMLFI